MDAVVAHLPTLIGYEEFVVGWRDGFDLASVDLGDTIIMAVDLATDPVVRTVLQELVKLGRFHFEQARVDCAHYNGTRALHGPDGPPTQCNNLREICSEMPNS